MNMTKQERTQVVRKISMSFIIAAVLAVLLAGTALAAVIGVPETLQDWFGQKWTEAGGGEEMPKEQSEIIDSLVQPIGVSDSSGGVTVTLDSAMPGEDFLWMLLSVEGGGKGDEEWMYTFGHVELTGPFVDAHQPTAPGVGQGSSWGFPADVNGVTKDGKLRILLYYRLSNNVPFQEGGEMELHLEDLVYETRTTNITVKGGVGHREWVLPFTLEPVVDQPVLTAKGALVSQDREGDPVEIQEIRVTSTGMSFLLNSGFRSRDGYLFAPLVTPDIALQLSGGTEVRATGMHGTWTGEIEKSPWEDRYHWELPVDLFKVESVRFGDVVIPLEQPKK